MITFLTGDMFGEKFNNVCDDLISKCDDLDFENIENTNEIISDFLELKETDKKISDIIDPLRTEIMTHQIIKLKALEKCRDKTVGFWHPMSTFHPYYVRKFAKQLVKLAQTNNHNFIILTNDEVVINEFRIGILQKQLNYENIKIHFYWKNEFIEIKLDNNGTYEVVPNEFGYEEYQDQLCRILEYESKLTEKSKSENSQ